MSDAPFHQDIAEGPTARATWLSADDGVRLRAAHWPGGGAGTVFVFSGRCEYVEKYGRVAADLTLRGYHALSVDWRGQGLSDRLLKDPNIGHVRRFADYQHDARALMAFAARERLPEPWLLLAHSMGGAIGLRSLLETDRFRAAAFSAPMWGIQFTKPLRHAASTIPRIARGIGLGHWKTPTTAQADFFLTAPFEGNMLTTDPETWDYMRRQTAAHDRFRLGGPSLVWLAEALTETRALLSRPRPQLPAHVSVGTEEKIVDPDAIRAGMGSWAEGTLSVVDGAEHELLMERPDIRTPFLARAFETFDKARVTA